MFGGIATQRNNNLVDGIKIPDIPSFFPWRPAEAAGLQGEEAHIQLRPKQLRFTHVVCIVPYAWLVTVRDSPQTNL